MVAVGNEVRSYKPKSKLYRDSKYFYKSFAIFCGPESLSRYSSSLWDGKSGDGIEVGGGGEFSVQVHTGPRAQQTSVQWVTGIFPGSKAAGAWR
jgi:hypothetical protein